MIYKGISYINELLFLAAIIMFAGLFLFNLGHFRQDDLNQIQ